MNGWVGNGVSATYVPPTVAPSPGSSPTYASVPPANAQVMQKWTTLTSSAGGFGTMGGLNGITQDQDQWLDMTPYDDVAVWIQGVVTSGTLLLETSPTLDEAYFQPITGTIATSSTGGVTVIKSVRAASTAPLARWLRWRLSGSSGLTSTFRIQVVPFRQSFFVPTQLSGCSLWLRPDLGITGGVTASQWNDQSASADPNKNLVQSNFSQQPVVGTSPSFNGAPTLQLQSLHSQYMKSAGSWATQLAQASTWVVVANNTGSAASAQYLLDSDDTTTGQTITYVPSTTTLSLSTFGGASITTTASLAGASGLLAEFNGASSKIYLNNFTTALTTTGGPLGGASQGSMTLGSQNASSGGPGSYWDGFVAEVIAYKRILSAAEKAQLRNYLNGRYGLSIQ